MIDRADLLLEKRNAANPKQAETSAGTGLLLTPPQLVISYADIASLNQTRDLIFAAAAYKTDVTYRSVKEVDPQLAIGYVTSVLNSPEVHDSPAYTSSGEERLNKKQPSFTEALRETRRRLLFLHDYLQELPNFVQGAIVGGSMSYGRFYNVRGLPADPSDIDILMITDGVIREEQSERIVRTDLGFIPRDLDLFKRRVPVFSDGNKRGTMDVLSHKFRIPTQGFDVSLHIMGADIFKAVFDTDLKKGLAANINSDKRLQDYKPRNSSENYSVQRDFFGSVHRLDFKDRNVYLGYVSEAPAFGIFEGRLVPGGYHNQCSPMFETALDRNRVAGVVKEFEIVMKDHARQMAKIDPTAELAKSHTRYDILSPYIISEVNR